VSRRRRRQSRSVRSLVVEAILMVGFIWLMLTVILPWAGHALTQNARDAFFPSPAPSASDQ
jgi:hypothetical protein